MAIKINYTDEFSRLTCVALYKPSLDDIEQSDAQKVMYSSIPSIPKVFEEFNGIVNKLKSLGIKVIVLDGNSTNLKSPNMIYLRDVAFIYRNRIILARMKHQTRQAEPTIFEDLLVSKAPELSKSIVKITDGTMEGADILVINNKSLLVYTGSRTDRVAIKQISDALNIPHVTDIPANIHGIPQHLLGGIHILDNKLLTRRVEYCTSPVEGFNEILFEESGEVASGLALNMVTIGPKEVLMPANRQTTKRKLEENGIRCHEIEIDEIHKMGGGLACMILPISRRSPGSS